jgi:hypothetical protein
VPLPSVGHKRPTSPDGPCASSRCANI